MAKVVKLIFVKSSGIGFLLEDKALEEYDRIHNAAILAYKKQHGILEKYGGKLVKCQYQPVNEQDVDPEALKAKICQLIQLKDNSTIIQLKEKDYQSYAESLFKGLSLLGRKIKFQGQLVKVQIN